VSGDGSCDERSEKASHLFVCALQQQRKFAALHLSNVTAKADSDSPAPFTRNQGELLRVTQVMRGTVTQFAMFEAWSYQGFSHATRSSRAQRTVRVSLTAPPEVSRHNVLLALQTKQSPRSI
jgi:hypothetical protein